MPCRWFYTDDKHIAATGGNACLSYGPDGALTTQACGNSGVDQVWELVPFGSNTPATPPDGKLGQRIYWNNGGVSGCLTVMDGALQNFGRIAMYVFMSHRVLRFVLTFNSAACMGDDNPYAYLQKFTYTRGSTKIKVATQTGGQDFCLDLGVVRRQDGTNLHLYQCVDVPQQQFWITDKGDDHIALEGEL